MQSETNPAPVQSNGRVRTHEEVPTVGHRRCGDGGNAGWVQPVTLLWQRLLLAGQNTSICTNQFHQRVPDYECNGSYGNAFVWYYLGRQSVVPYYGQTVFGGGYTRTAGATYFHAPVAANVTRSVAVSRGGFGSSARTYSAPVGSSISSYSSGAAAAASRAAASVAAPRSAAASADDPQADCSSA
jgi:hypothetical protein